MNPVAVVFWLFLFLAGYLLSGVNVGLICMTVGIGFSLLLTFLSR